MELSADNTRFTRENADAVWMVCANDVDLYRDWGEELACPPLLSLGASNVGPALETDGDVWRKFFELAAEIDCLQRAPTGVPKPIIEALKLADAAVAACKKRAQTRACLPNTIKWKQTVALLKFYTHMQRLLGNLAETWPRKPA